MTHREFFNFVVKMRKAQKDYEKLQSTRHRMFKADYERIVDQEIERVERIKQQQADNQQQQLL
ncbi:MAG: hypothetical protein J6V00_07805 [Bacteroidaceae bacterium]|nr:hypothetical protein [Bacteroidaceae bacterium]